MKRHISVFTFLLSTFAAVGLSASAAGSVSDIMRLSPVGYRLGATGGVTAYDSSVVTVTPSNTSSVVSNKSQTLTANLNRDYKVIRWQKFADDPAVRPDVDPIEEFGEKSKTVSVDFNPNVTWMYVTVVVEYDPVRTVKASVSSFGEGTVSVSPEKTSYLKDDVVTLTAEPAEGYAFVRWSDGNTDHARTLTVDGDLDLKAYIEPKASLVTFSAGEGAVLDVTSKRVSFGNAYGELPTPTRTGAKFSGWEDDNKRTVTEKTAVSRAADHTLYAFWSDLLYEIAWDFTGRGNGKVDGTGAYAYGSQPTLKAVPYEGSAFTGWADGVTQNPRRITVLSNALYVAAFDVATYDVTFTYRDEAGNPVTAGPTTVEHGGKVDPPSKDVVDSWPEHTFKTWSTEEYKKVTRDLAVEAIYDAMTYSVAFTYRDWQGNCVTTMPQHVVSGGSANPPSKDVVDNWEGNTFKGWDPDYNVIRENTLCEAIYETNTYTVTFSYRGSDGEPREQVETVQYGGMVQSVPETVVVDSWPGHRFLGWSNDDYLRPITGKLEVFARYEGYCTIVYGDSLGTNYWDDVKDPKDWTTLRPVEELNRMEGYAFRKTGYLFNYWSEERREGTNTVVFTYEDQAKVPVQSGDVLALKSNWKGITYKVRFDGNGGKCNMPDADMTYDKPHTDIPVHIPNGSPGSPQTERDNYTLLGWSQDPVGESGVLAVTWKGTYIYLTINTNLTATAGDVVTLYAIWQGEPQKVKISETINGVETNFDAYVAYGSQWKPADPVRTGYAFAGGWTSNGVPVTLPITVTGSFELKSEDKWTTNEYTVVFHGTDADGGAMEPQEFTYDVEQALTSNGFTRTGHTFANWTNAVGTAFADGARVKNLATNDGAVVDLYATWTINPRYYAVKFNPNGGTGDAYVQAIECGVETALTSNRFTRTGYGFANWTDAEGTVYVDGAKVTDLAAEGETNDLHAVWTPNRYWVAFDGNGAAVGLTMEPQAFTYDVAQHLTSNGYVKTGHAFAGWATNATGSAAFTDGAAVSNLTAEADATNTLWATWTANKYTVVIDGVSVEMDYGSDIARPADPAARKGYTFTGWTTNGAPVAAWPLKVPLGGLTILSHWAPNAYTVEFRGTDGTYETHGTMEPQEFIYDVAQALSANGFARDRYVFAGWATNAADAVVRYEDGAVVSNLTAAAGGVVTLWATWTDAPNYTVRFNSNGGEGAPYLQGILCGVETALTSNRFTRKGYGFANWTDAEGTVYVDGAKVTDLAAEGETNELCAAWTPNSYWVAFDGNGADVGLTMEPQAFTYDVAQHLTSNGYAKTGYAFAGWATNATGSAAFTDGAVVSNLTAEADATNTLWATWTANTYTVRFNPNGGSGEAMASQVFTYDKAQPLKENTFTPPETWMTFAGWSNATDKVIYTAGAVVSNLTAEANGTVDLHAVWIDDSYTVTFDGNGNTGGAMEPQVFKHGATGALTPNAYVRTGFGFKNWTNDVGGVYTNGASFTAPSTGIGETLYVVWTNCAYYCWFDGEKDGPYHYGDKIDERSNTNKFGYVFLGWTNETGVVDLKTFTMPDHDVAFGSKWEPITYTIAFDGNGATEVAMAPTNVKYDVEIALPSNTYVWAGHEFVHWTNTTGNIFTDGKKVKNLATTSGAEVVLYAVWQEAGNPFSIALGLDANFDVEVSDEGAWTVIGEPKEKNGLQRTSTSSGGMLRVPVPSAGTLRIDFDAGGSVINGLTYSDGSHSATKKNRGNYSISVESACTVTFSGTPDSGCTWTLKNFTWTPAK